MDKLPSNKTGMKLASKLIVGFASLLLIIAAGTGVYVWQHKKVDGLNQQLLNAKGTNSSLKNQNDNLTKQLNTSNQAVYKLTQSSTFTPNASCQSEQLALSQERTLPGASGGFTGQLFSYQNVSKVSCTVKGYPGFLALASNGDVVPNGPIKTGSILSDPGSTSITLAPNDKAYFALTWNNPAAGYGNSIPPQYYCLTASLVESTPPGNLYPLVIATSGPQICNDNLTISALAPLSDFDLPTNSE